MRICVGGFYGTVKYNGSVGDTTGTWLGVEWDDPARGKHNGAKDGVYYFRSSVPGSGSFIRPSKHVRYGRTFLEALQSKYVEQFHGSHHKELTTLGSSNSLIKVEAVDLDKIRGKLSQLNALREVSLDGEEVAFAGTPGEIRDACPNIRGLDLSSSLFYDWDTIFKIASQLPRLETLSLNRNRFAPVQAAQDNCFPQLRDLRLNRTLVPWGDILSVVSVMPKLCSLEAGYNCPSVDLSDNSTTVLVSPTLDSLNLEGNNLDNWRTVISAIQPLPNLQRLSLTSNHLTNILPRPPGNVYSWPNLRHVGLVANGIADWKVLDALCTWFPSLDSLNMDENPLCSEKHFRQLAIARVASLHTLNGTKISTRERTDSELFYLSHVAQQRSSSSSSVSVEEDPRWLELCQKHGKPEGTIRTENTLGGRLIRIHVSRIDSPPSTSAPSPSTIGSTSTSTLETSTIKALPTMSIRHFRLKLLKVFRATTSQPFRAWVSDDDTLVEIDFADDRRDLDWWSIRDQSKLLLYFV